jgi:4-hydroxysphinganine ceramide fatty acyl 2-hydroxylase
MLDEFRIGRLGAEESVVSDNWVATDDFTPEDTDEAADYEKNQFLDLRKPLMQQMWDGNFRHVFLCEAYCDRVMNDHIFPQQSILPSTSPSTPTPPRICPSLWIPST